MSTSVTIPIPGQSEATRVAGYRVPGDVVGSIRQAAAATGMDFGYMMAQAAQESSFDADARAATSSATGLYQFIDQTWLQVMHDHGADHGLGHLSDQITPGRDGRYRVSDPETRREIMELRNDPAVAATMAGAFAGDNQAYLEGRLGRSVDSTDLYLAHFLGAGGAGRFLEAMDANPGRSGAALFPEAAQANRGVFYNRNGGARSLAQIHDFFSRKIEPRAEAFRTAFAGPAAPTLAAMTPGGAGGIPFTTQAPSAPTGLPGARPLIEPSTLLSLTETRLPAPAANRRDDAPRAEQADRTFTAYAGNGGIRGDVLFAADDPGQPMMMQRRVHAMV